MGYEKFVNNFSCYFNSFENTKGKTNLLRMTLKKIVETELPSRDRNQLFQIRDFTNSDNLDINLIYKNLWCKQGEKNRLIVGTLCPDWRNGWKRICKDEFISGQISNFFYLATQYICRSYQINLIAAICFTYNRICDFRGNTLQIYSIPYCEQEFLDFNDSISCNTNSRIGRLQHYLKIINSLDPYVNKAIFYYIKALDLYNKDFFEEAITNLDNAIDTISQYIKEHLKKPTMPRKDIIEIVSDEMKISCRIKRDLEKLYLLRCRFSSHPAQSKWWDFGELYDEDIMTIFESVKYTLIKMLQYETNNRKISPNSDKWSNWFIDNADMLFDAIWFHKIP